MRKNINCTGSVRYFLSFESLEEKKPNIELLKVLHDFYVSASNGSARPETITTTKKGSKRQSVSANSVDQNPTIYEKSGLVNNVTVVRDAKDCKGFMRMIERAVASMLGETIRY